MAYRYTRDRLLPGVYHVYSRAKNGVKLFRDDDDRRHFEYLVRRHLSSAPQTSSSGRVLVNLRASVRLIALNPLSTHFHLILWQKTPGGIELLMRRVVPIYTRYYHRKYGTTGSLFDHEYCARRVTDRGWFRWLVGYVHDNHAAMGLDWPFSTHRLYLAPSDAPNWLEVEATLRQFGGLEAYLAYLERRQLRNTLDRELRYERTLFQA
ncbi:MAG: hypothetical protein QM648_07270 [Solirubrobacterales bacterium]